MPYNKELKLALGNTHSSTTYTFQHIKVLIVSAILLLMLFAFQLIGSYFSKSLALLSDSIHVFSDFLGIFSSLIAILIAKKINDTRRTYGYSKIEAIVSFANCIVLFVMIIYILYESFYRTFTQHIVDFKTLIAVASFGLFANVLIAYYVFKKGHIHSHNHSHHHSHNNHTHKEHGLLMQNVLLHFTYDIAGSVIAIASGIVIYLTGWFFIDILLSIVISIILSKSTYILLKRSIVMLLDSAPSNIDIVLIKQTVEKLHSNIINAHHIHVWMLNETDIAATLHIILHNNTNINQIIIDIKTTLHNNFNINHTTIQTEINNSICIDNILPSTT